MSLPFYGYSCVDRRQQSWINPSSQQLPGSLRSSKSGLRVLSKANFSHPISPDVMNLLPTANSADGADQGFFFFPAEQSSLKEKQIQQNVFFVDIFNGKLLKHFTSILAFGQFCLIWHEVIKIQQRSPCWNYLFQSFKAVPLQEGCPEIPKLK